MTQDGGTRKSFPRDAATAGTRTALSGEAVPASPRKAVSAGMLYLVGTPIGNLEDVTMRALRVLREVNVVAAEDTRSARTLLRHYDIATPVTSFHDFTGPTKRRRLVDRLTVGDDIALISDAGMPAISDPGYPLVREALAAGCRVTSVPGPSAVLTALVLSSLPAHAFHYVGFLPRKAGERRRLLNRLALEADTIICFESPHRLVGALGDIVAAFGPERRVAVGRELTKKFEEVIRGTSTEALDHFEQVAPRGEFTLVIAGTDDAHDDARRKDNQDDGRELGLGKRDVGKRDSGKLHAEMKA